MRFPTIIIFTEGAFCALVGATWWWLGYQHEAFIGWRRKASLLALVVPTVAIIVELLLGIVLRFAALEELDAATLHGGWSSMLARLWLWLFFATGALSVCGLLLAAVGLGRPRVAGALWSAMSFVTFLVCLVLGANSFH